MAAHGCWFDGDEHLCYFPAYQTHLFRARQRSDTTELDDLYGTIGKAPDSSHFAYRL